MRVIVKNRPEFSPNDEAFMKRITLLMVVAGAVFVGGLVRAQEPAVRVQGYHIDGPATPADFPKWIADMKLWRAEFLKKLRYDDSEYRRPELLWAQSSFMQPQMMIEDRYFYDPAAGRYTVNRYLDDLEKRYGGIDSVLIWPVYPNIGIDNRNEFDCFRDMPGGIPGIKQMVADFHKRGVRVLFPYMPWDQGTRQEDREGYDVIAENLAAVGADGINGDTMPALPRTFRVASDKTGHPLAFEPEGLSVDEGLAYNNMNWGQAAAGGGGGRGGRGGTGVPPVAKYKWLEPRHMINISDRWQRDKNVDLQYAFFNGIGMETWENIWGIWNEMTPRDSEICRRIGKVDRNFAELLVSADWEPHTPAPLQSGIYASRFPGKDQTLWTIINKNEFDVSGQQIRVPHQEGRKYYDLWHGVELTPEMKDGNATLSFEIEASGYGALLATDTASPLAGLKKVLGEMKILARTRLSSFSRERRFLPQQVVEIPATKRSSDTPAGMVTIPAGEFEFQVQGIEIEGSNEIGVDVQYPWEDSPRRNHRHTIHLKSFHIDRYPVSNAAFKKFVDAANYRPKDDHNFLKDWKNGSYPAGWENKPVTWISIEDARAYATWAGKRLPHEWEWQYAAQGSDGRTYPWGNSLDPEAAPVQGIGHDLPGPDNVDAHPAGASPFGVMDLTANVWQWTDEYLDEHTRAAILRGGSNYHPQGSMWYFPEAYKLTEHGKLLLMSPGKDRAGTVGFRCVVDAQ
jgi:formylglycine-generating enzyme required for sulfatase activity